MTAVAAAGPDAPAALGLTATEVEARVRRGEVNVVRAMSSRSVWSILVANLLTPFNLLLAALLVAILVVGPLQDALFGLVLVVNTPIGVIQELRAKRLLDRLAVVTAQRSCVVRDGSPVEVPSATIVVDDVVRLGSGDQVPVDADVIESSALEVDESLLTGEAAAVPKAAGDEVLSGSFVVAGTGLVRATRVGPAAYGNALAASARRFTPVRSDLRRGINRFLVLIGVVIGPVGALLVLSQVSANDTPADAVRLSVAGLVTMVPEGLVLLTSVVFAVAAIRFAQHGMVVQELASVEMLARADVICLDKTGTLTDGRMVVDRVVPLAGDVPEDAVAALAGCDPDPNQTTAAIARAFPHDPVWPVLSRVPFASTRGWSAATFAAHGTWVLGAPDVLAPASRPEILATADALGRGGCRVVLVGRLPSPPADPPARPDVDPVALVVLREHLRDTARDVIAYYREQGVTVRVLSGDHPATVAALATAAGLELVGDPVDARALPEDPATLADLAEHTTVFGRVRPHQKQDIVRALQSRGHVVAMTGDGVNDVLALKAADIGVAMGSGSAASRAVARLTLLADSFTAVPFAIAEGRRVIANLERVAAFFLTKTVYAFVISMAVVVRMSPFPLLPRQLSLVGLVAVGLPAFALSFARSAERARPAFVRRTLRFVVPAGLLAGVAADAGFELATAEGAGINDARTVATIVLIAFGLWIVARVARPLRPWKVALVTALGVLTTLVFLVPLGRLVYGVDLIGPSLAIRAVLIAAAAALVLEVTRAGARSR